MADGTVTQGAVLGGGHEAGLSGRRFLDLPLFDAGETAGGGLAVRAIRDVQDGIAEKDPRWPDTDS
ncbi:hypothetical protein D9M73_278430 [compost metagenome]